MRGSSSSLLTQLSIAGVITATVVKVPQAAVPGQCVHDARRADGMNKGCFSICCQRGIQREQICKRFHGKGSVRNCPTMQESVQDICSGEDFVGVKKRPYMSD